jgi:hypothetical protein
MASPRENLATNTENGTTIVATISAQSISDRNQTVKRFVPAPQMNATPKVKIICWS